MVMELDGAAGGQLMTLSPASYVELLGLREMLAGQAKTPASQIVGPWRFRSFARRATGGCRMGSAACNRHVRSLGKKP